MTALKTCNTCNTVKPPKDFYPHRNKCKSCVIKQTNDNDTPEQIRNRAYKRQWKLLGIHLTRKQAITQLEAQNYSCAICKDDLTEVRWAYDHNHHTKKLRKILCYNCNIGIGKLNDDPYLLRLAALYIEEHND